LASRLEHALQDGEFDPRRESLSEMPSLDLPQRRLRSASSDNSATPRNSVTQREANLLASPPLRLRPADKARNANILRALQQNDDALSGSEEEDWSVLENKALQVGESDASVGESPASGPSAPTSPLPDLPLRPRQKKKKAEGNDPPRS